MERITRRGLVSAAPAAVVAAAAPALASANPDAALLALREPFTRTWKAYTAALDVHGKAEAAAWHRHRVEPGTDRKQIDDEEGLTAADALVDRTGRANHEIVERMCETPARSIEGLAFKAKVSLEHEDNRFEELVASIMDDILALGGAHA